MPSVVPMAPVTESARTERAAALMRLFADRTGLTSPRMGRRYLWTDAFAVCTFLALARATGDPRHAELAMGLVDRVHHALGRHRPDDSRRGWISGLDEHEGSAHPTRGGLRIGKELAERSPGEPFDESLEWDRDGQYFHYLTKWMHALDQASRFAGRPELNVWARELAAAAHSAFSYDAPGQGRRMHWKMSIDLTRPLVRSMGQHDPLDGYVTCLQLEATASALGGAGEPALRDAISDFRSMLLDQELTTADPLGIGGLLTDACRAEQLRRYGSLGDGSLVDVLLRAAVAGLEWYRQSGELRAPAEQRLAFRELGLAIGLHGAAFLRDSGAAGSARSALLDALRRHEGLRAEIEAFWLEPRHQAVPSWTEHRDINDVMLATSLVPDGFLRLERPPSDPA